jgi:hypothetical protein
MKLTRKLNLDDLFKGRRFDREIIVLCVRWYERTVLRRFKACENPCRSGRSTYESEPELAAKPGSPKSMIRQPRQ